MCKKNPTSQVCSFLIFLNDETMFSSFTGILLWTTFCRLSDAPGQFSEV